MNTLLQAMSDTDRARLERDLKPMAFKHGQMLFDVGSELEKVYFVDSGVVSLVGVYSDGSTAEIAAVGNEGFVNVGSLLDDDLAVCRHTVQVPGLGQVMPSEILRDTACASPALMGLLHRYVQAHLGQVSQSVACNCLHRVEERLARWLLMMHDRSDGDDLLMTHDFLAQMLGVRRATVTVYARMFQAAGFIRYRRGHIAVTDREGLEDASCECYAIVRDLFRRLLPEPQ